MQFQTEWNPGIDHELLIGVDLWRRDLRTEREKQILIEVLDVEGNVVAENNLVRGELPIPDSRFNSVGLFMHEEWQAIQDRLYLSLGGRFDQIFVTNEAMVDPVYTILNGTLNSEPPNQRIAFPEGEASDLSWSANAGMVFRPVDYLDVTLSLARSFRSPSLEGRYK